MEIRVLLSPPHSDEKAVISADALSHMIEDLQAPGRTIDLSMKGLKAQPPARVLHAETQWGNAVSVTLEVKGPLEAMLRAALSNPPQSKFSMGYTVAPTAPPPPPTDPFKSLTDAKFTLSHGNYYTDALPEARRVLEQLEACVKPMGLRSFPHIHLTVSTGAMTKGEICFEVIADFMNPKFAENPKRIGFVCDPNPAESSWFFVSSQESARNDVRDACGLLSELTPADYQRLVKLVT